LLDSEISKELVRALNRCIETCTDGEKGYGVAAADVRAPELKALFHTYAKQRGDFVVALQEAIRTLGGFPENEGTLRGALHRSWMTCRGLVTGRKDRDILEGCAFGERAALDAYEAADRAVVHAVPDDLRALVREQYADILDAHADLRDRLKRG
jgi:uncharacterized protein (TIGR02284 family)